MLVTYVGHSTLLIELDGLRVLTDPVLRRRVAHLVRHAPAVDRAAISGVDLVLVSHLHHDHFDPRSLRSIEGSFDLIVPRGAGSTMAKLGFERRMRELAVGESLAVKGVTVTATRAMHRKGRLFDRRSEAIGFTVAGTQRAYFAGDTEIFSEMRELSGDLDIALLPVGGWGPRVGPGHMDPGRAAEAAAILEPRVAVPIHWGTLHRIGLRSSRRERMREAPRVFARDVARRAPGVEVRVLEPGQTTKL